MTENAFPDVRWGRDPGARLRRAAGVLIGTKAVGWVVRRLTPLDRWLLNHSSGRLTIFGPIAAPLLLLTTTGRRSGQRRQTPLAYMREGNRIFLVGSNFGQAHHPAWALNLSTDPNAWVTIGGEEIPVLATPVIGAEHDRIYGKFVDYISNYASYEHRAQRDIRVFALSRR